MSSVNEIIPVNIEPYVSTETIGKAARESGFLKRNRKITPVSFIQSCCLLAVHSVSSFNAWSVILGFLIGTTISKQALYKRINPSCVQFVRTVLFSVLQKFSHLRANIEKGTFSHFKRLLVQDSTSLKLPAGLAALFPGSGNQHTSATATLKLQTVYDALAENFITFSPSSFRRNDQSASGDILKIIRPGDLVLRDLGYFCLDVLRQIGMSHAFFLTRYPHKLNLYYPDGSPFDLLKTLQRFGSLDINLLAGCKERLPVRLVAIPVSPEVANSRRRKLRKNRNGSMNPSREHMALLDWEIFLTNVPDYVWSTKDIGNVYGVRWRIEIIFKSWKQNFNFTRFTNASRYQVEVLIYSRLLFITLFQTSMFRPWASSVRQNTGQYLSLLKVTQFISQHFGLIIQALSSPEGRSLVQQQIIKHCTYDKRKRINYQCIIEMLCLS